MDVYTKTDEVTGRVVRRLRPTGLKGRQEDILWVGKTTTIEEETSYAVVFFPGDLMDVADEMKRAGTEYQEFSLERTAFRIAERFPHADLWVVRAPGMDCGGHADFDIFLEQGRGTAHLGALIENATTTLARVYGLVTSAHPLLTLVGFSRGCNVVKRFLQDWALLCGTEQGAPSRGPASRIANQARAVAERVVWAHWIGGRIESFPSDTKTLEALARGITEDGSRGVRVAVHDEAAAAPASYGFLTSLRLMGVDVPCGMHFDASEPSLDDHFHLLDEWDPTLEGRGQRMPK